MRSLFFRNRFSTLIITVLKNGRFLTPSPYTVKNYAR